MKRIAILCNCSYTYLALSTLITNTYLKSGEDVEIKRAKLTIDIHESDVIVLIINEANIFACSEFVINLVKRNIRSNILIISDMCNLNIFTLITGQVYDFINIHSCVNDVNNAIENAACSKIFIKKIIKQHRKISPKEIEVIRLLSIGFTMTDISKIKHISIKTISAHKCNFFKKIGLKNSPAVLLKLTNQTMGKIVSY